MARALERVLLGDVAVVAARLATLRAAGVVDVEPTPWQLCLGALRLWHRALFRPETVGTAPDGVVRPTWRARLLANRALRLPANISSGAYEVWLRLYQSDDSSVQLSVTGKQVKDATIGILPIQITVKD